MSFCRQTSRVYCDVDDLEGALNVLSRTIKDDDDPVRRAFLKGAYFTVLVLRHYEKVETQAEFIPILLNFYKDEYE